MTSDIGRVRIAQQADVLRLRHGVSDAASAAGMDEQERNELEIVATELATNVIKHSGVGEASVAWDDDQHEVTIVTRNPASGIRDVDGIFKDGISTAGTFGIGLGAVRRLCDDVDIHVEGGELVVRATKRHQEETTSFIETSVLSRPLPGYQENGDGYYIGVYSDSALLAVIDGLGHGPHAEEATLRAISVIASDDRAPLLDIVAHMHKNLRRTRGCVVGIARVDLDGRLEYVGVGNIRAHIFSHHEDAKSLLSYSGVVGGNMRTLRVMSYDMPHRAILAIYSDGVGHLSGDRLPSSPLMEITGSLFTENAKPTDDATLLMARMK